MPTILGALLTEDPPPCYLKETPWHSARQELCPWRTGQLAKAIHALEIHAA
jgi:hypothetical protein